MRQVITATVITTSLARVSISAHLWDFAGVNRQINIRRLLAIAVIAGLVLAPLSRPVMAGTASDASMPAVADDMSMSAMADEMTADMPCCPSKAPAPADCDKCIYMAACMIKCFTGLSAATFGLPFAASTQIAPPQNDFWPDGMGHPPPEHPRCAWS
ncbi:MAG: hypothetical protein E6G93_14950 [Alphaproteobacteria bacterium]|nr:MAG: hypothetical protein E6G93_14950 [Alphaproteobacteria bacterium]